MRNWTILFFILLCVFSSVYCVVARWGEKCQYTAECGDHRLVCEEISDDVDDLLPTKICVCDRYHEWNGTDIGCIQKYNSTAILEMISEKYNIAERIEYEADVVFLAQIAAGLIVMAVGLLCSVIVGVYCFYMYKEDTELEDLLVRLESQKKKDKPTTSQSTSTR